jgi:YfiH family protein
MRFADSVPIFLFDPRRKVIGLAHAGWQGTILGVAQAAVQAMQARYSSRPADILAAIGPSIGPDHYEVGPDVIAQVRRKFGSAADSVLTSQNDSEKIHYDLWTANRLALLQTGVSQVEISGLCTACHVEDWYSHRREHGKTGRFGALLGL